MVFTNKKFAADDRRYFGLGHKAYFGFSFSIGCFDGFVFLLHRRNKMKGPHHIGVVGQGDGRHLVLRSGLDQVLGAHGGLQYRKLAVVVQVSEVVLTEIYSCPSADLGGAEICFFQKGCRSRFEVLVLQSCRGDHGRIDRFKFLVVIRLFFELLKRVVLLS